MDGDRGPQLEAVFISYFVLCLVAVSLRSYTMGIILKRFFVEDYLAVLGLFLYIGFATTALVSVHYGLGKYIKDVPPEDRPIAAKYRFVASLFYILCSYLVKAIVGLFLVRICSASHQKWQRMTIWFTLAFVGLFYGVYFFIAIFACQPVHFIWTRYNPVPDTNGRCNAGVAATSITYIATILNILADWLLAILPATVVWQAKLDRRTKISISIILAFGSIASIATVVRVLYAKQILDEEYLHNFTDLAIWSTIEIGTALTASSLATLKPLFKRLRVIYHTTQRSTRGLSSSVNERPPTTSCGQRGKYWQPPPGTNPAQQQPGYYHHVPGRKLSRGTSSISIPIQGARWNHADDSDEIEMIRGGPGGSSPVTLSDEISPVSPKTVYYKKWEEDIV